MIITEEQIETRLNSAKNIIHRGYGKSQNAQPDQPEFLREVEAGLCVDGETQRSVAEVFEVKQPTVSYAFNGKTLSSQGKDKLKNRKEQIQDAALDKLFDTLGLMSEEKLNKCKAVELSQIAGNMAKVVDKMDRRESNVNNILIIHAPKMKREDEFETVTI